MIPQSTQRAQQRLEVGTTGTIRMLTSIQRMRYLIQVPSDSA